MPDLRDLLLTSPGLLRPRARSAEEGWGRVRADEASFWAAAPVNRPYLVVGSLYSLASAISDAQNFTAAGRGDALLDVLLLVVVTAAFLLQWWRSTIAATVLLCGAYLLLPHPGPLLMLLYLPLVLGAAIATARSARFAVLAAAAGLAWPVVWAVRAGQFMGLWLLVPVVGAGVGVGAFIRSALRRRERDREALADAQRRAREAAERERRLLARDLHDIVAHNLTIITMQARTARYLGTPEAAEGALDVVADSARDALLDLRRMLAVLQEEGVVEDSVSTDGTQGATAADLVAGAERMAAELEGLGIVTECRIDAGLSAPLSVRTALYRVMQEAATNVAKHAGPGARCRLSAAREGAELVLTVENTLTGDTAASPHGGRPGDGNSSGIGLASMRDRVETFGGTLTAGPDGGRWRVRAAIPVPPGSG